MKPMTKSWVSPFLLITYISTSVTGIFMLFHIKFWGLYPIHEWGGVAFIIAGVLHVILNWKLLTSYFNKNSHKTNAILGTAFGVILLIVIALIVPSKSGRDYKHYHAISTPISVSQNQIT